MSCSGSDVLWTVATAVSQQLSASARVDRYVSRALWPRVGPAHPSSPLIHLFPLFTFPFLSLALPIFFFCPSLLFLPE